MEEILSRFTHIAINIFDQLNDKDFKNCSKVSRSWKNFIKNEKFSWIRIIKKFVIGTNENYTKCPKIWRKMFQGIKIENMQKFAIVIRNITNKEQYWKSIYEGLTPLHLVLRYEKEKKLTVPKISH